MVLDASLLSTQHYKVRIKGKVEQSRKGVAPPLHIGVVAIEKGAFGLPSTMVANFYFTLLFVYETRASNPTHIEFKCRKTSVGKNITIVKKLFRLRTHFFIRMTNVAKQK